MLRALSIRNVLLIDRLDLMFASGLGVLTGETGTGKSILLDAMGLALGGRASPQLIRVGETQASVTAEFDLAVDAPVYQTLQELGVSIEDGELFLRRVLNTDGKSRAFVNDQPVSLALLKNLGETLVEIHGQFDQLFNPSTHRCYLNHFGRLESDLEKVRTAFTAFDQEKRTICQAHADLANREAREVFLKQDLDELEKAALKTGEEEQLLTEREYLQHHTKIMEAAQGAYGVLGGEKGAEVALAHAHRTLERGTEAAGGVFKEALAALGRASVEVQEALSLLLSTLRRTGKESQTLESIEDRLYTLRGLARKHGCTVEGLVSLQQKFQQEYEHLGQGKDYIRTLEQNLEAKKEAYLQAALSLSKKRQEVSRALEKEIQGEFMPLKLEKASFRVNVTRLAEEDWNAEGIDRVEFQVQTNPGMPFGPLSKIASGGERARIMLALKVMLAQENSVSLLIFDEIDTGVGGAVSSAIGERLSHLGKHLQVLAVTHAPQVAAYADFHWRVSKDIQGQKAVTQVIELDAVRREEEMARMLAGESITQEARAAARRLLEAGRAA